ncbi:MAG: serine/threonine-protein phosphatase [Myxococcales bacterium FL481]|nr:MAG: serine/threonine-protein phosphatase [Myxococcales bacterium FL481]
MRLRYFGHTDVGLSRAHNEDAFLADPELGLFVVCDGVGGRARGEIASAETADLIWEWVKREQPVLRRASNAASLTDEVALGRVLRGAIQNACYLVHSMGELNPDQKGMSTTASAMLVVGETGIVGQVGDSRVYMARDGVISQVTEDHTLVNYQLKHGLITEAQARASTAKNVITRAVGHREYVDVDIVNLSLRPGDRFLLCSDGLHGYLEDADDVVALMGQDVESGVLSAIEHANARGGSDNITAMMLELLE